MNRNTEGVVVFLVRGVACLWFLYMLYLSHKEGSVTGCIFYAALVVSIKLDILADRD